MDQYPVCCKGKFVGADDRFIVLEGGSGNEHTKMWIPMSDILDFYLTRRMSLGHLHPVLPPVH